MTARQRKIVEDYIAEYGFCTDIRTDHESLYKLVEDAQTFILQLPCEYQDERKNELEKYVNQLDATYAEKDLIYDCTYLFAKL